MRKTELYKDEKVKYFAWFAWQRIGIICLKLDPNSSFICPVLLIFTFKNGYFSFIWIKT